MRILTALAVASGLAFWAGPARAAAVNGYSGTDGFSPAPIEAGTSMVDMRLNMLSSDLSASPTLNVLTGLTNGLELGLGSALTLAGFDSGLSVHEVDTVYPWLRAALPSPLAGLRLGGMLGGDIPVTGRLEPGAGAALLADYPVGPLLLGVNAGYKRGFASGTNRLSANLNACKTLERWMFYAEGAINQPIGGPADEALRGTLAFALSQRLTLDVNPAVLFTPGAVFNLNVGASYTY